MILVQLSILACALRTGVACCGLIKHLWHTMSITNQLDQFLPFLRDQIYNAFIMNTADGG